MSDDKTVKTPTEKLLELKHELEFDILNDANDSKYSKFIEKGYLKSIDAALEENPSDAIKKIVYDSIYAAYTTRRLNNSYKQELSRVKEIMAQTAPDRVIVAGLADSFERMTKSMGDRFKQVYQKAKEQGYYPDKMAYFDWLWHELEVIKSSGTYLKNKALSELDASEAKSADSPAEGPSD